MPSGRIVVAGDVIDDIVVVPSVSIRPDTDTPSSIRFRAGGSAANTAAWLGTVGADVDFVGIVGESDIARHAELLSRWGVRPHLAISDRPTGTIIVLVDGEQRAMLTERGANAVFDPATINDDLLQGSRALLLTGHSLSGQTTAASLRALITRARDLDVAVVVSPGSAGHIADAGVQTFLQAFAGATVLLPSLEEAQVLTGLDAPDAAAAALAEFTPLVVLTNGGHEILVAQGSSIDRVAVTRSEVVDPTGAGDAFAAGFLAHWVRFNDPVGAAHAGAKLAAKSLAIVGGRPLA